jgi:hypothetical protein
VNHRELYEFLPTILEAHCTGRYGEVAPSGGNPGLSLGWCLSVGDTIALLRAANASLPFLWFRGGLAQLPRSEELAFVAAEANKDLMTGRIYLTGGETHRGVVYDESIFAPFIDPADALSMNHLRVRMEVALEYTEQWSTKLRERFGGFPFSATERGGALGLTF